MPPESAAALTAGIGSRIDCLLGGKTDEFHGAPIELKGAYVKTISDGAYINKNPMGYGGRRNMGATVLLQVGNVGYAVLSAERHIGCPQCQSSVGR